MAAEHDDLELVVSFANTFDAEEGTDALATPDGLAGWLAEHDFPPAVTPAQWQRAVAVRDGLRALALANNAEPLDEDALAPLNGVSEAVLRVRFGGDGATLQARGEGGDSLLARLLAAVARAMAEDTWWRVKACRAETCQYVFYDRSRNRSRAWCSMAICGNRAKSRTFRQRHDA